MPKPKEPKDFKMLFHDSRHDNESWRVIWVFSFEGTLLTRPTDETDPDGSISQAEMDWQEEQNNLLRAYIMPNGVSGIRSEGCGGAGQRFAHSPWVDEWTGFVIVSQTGGLDV